MNRLKLQRADAALRELERQLASHVAAPHEEETLQELRDALGIAQAAIMRAEAELSRPAVPPRGGQPAPWPAPIPFRPRRTSFRRAG